MRAQHRPRRAVAVELCGDESREAGRGAADGRLHLAIDRLGPEVEPGSQACPDAAALIDTAQGVVRLGHARGHALNLGAEPAHAQEQAPPHLTSERLREYGTRARHGDPQTLSGGMVPELPSWSLDAV